YYTSKKAGRAGLRFVNERTFVAGPVEDLVQQIVRPAAAPNPLVPALRLAAEKHLTAGGVQVPQAVAAELKAQLDRQPNDGRFETFFEKSFRPLLEVQTAAAAIDLGRDAELTVRFMFPSDDAAKEALWPARDG